MATEHTSLLADTHTWVLISAIFFLILAIKVGKKPLLELLDNRSIRIRDELEEAERLKEEAQALLDDYKKKHADAVETAQEIINQAKESSEVLHKEAKEKFEETIKRREDLLIERIERAEETAIRDLRHKAADLAAQAAEQLLIDAMPKRGAKLIDDSIKGLSKKAS